MNKIYSPDFVGKSDKAVVLVASSLDEELDNVLERFHSNEEVAYRFEWSLATDDSQKYMVVFCLEFDSGEKVCVGLSPYHWDCLPALLSLGHMVLMTDNRLLGDQDGVTQSESGKPRALVIENAFMGLEKLVGEASQKLQDENSENLNLLLKLFEVPGESEQRKQH